VLIINAITIRALDAKLRLPAYVGLAETQSGEGPVSDDRIVERRTTARSRQLKSGSIIFNENKSVLSCIVRNVSKGGLCLLVPIGLTVPMAFDLSSAGERRHCAVVWRLPDRIGVKYH
jgi:PilZ domain